MIPTPLDGDPDSIADHARVYKSTALRLKNAADDLRDLTDDATFISLAVDEVRLKALDARTATESVHVRYDGAADAMSQYAIDLRAAQDRANSAISTYMGADGEQSAASRLADDLEESVKTDNGQTPNLVDDFLQAKRALERFAASTAAALTEYNAAVQDKMDAVNRAIKGLKDAADSSNLNDGFFEAIGGAFQGAYEWAQENLTPLLEVLHDVLDVINKIVSVLAFIVTIAAIFIPVLAPLALGLQIASLALSALILTCSLALVFLGKGSLGDVIGETIGLVASAVLFGAGPGIKGAIAVAGRPAASAALSAATREAIELPATQEVLIETGLFLVEQGAGGAAGEVGNAVGDPLDVDLFPSAAGPSWNAPPTIQIPPVNTNYNYSMAEVVEGPIVESVSASASQPVSAGASPA
ncbi:MAG: hypothetical protein ABWY54_01235 [Glaciihabitans sp.]